MSYSGPYSKKALKAHPGANPDHVPGSRSSVMLMTGERVKGPRNPTRWLPHQGVRECARRVRQMQERANGHR